jgi:hypothetical protein
MSAQDAEVLTDEKRELLRALHDVEWSLVSATLDRARRVSATQFRIASGNVCTVRELGRRGLTDAQEREHKRGAYLYRRTDAGRAALLAKPRR